MGKTITGRSMLGIAVFILLFVPVPVFVLWVLFGGGRLQAEIYSNRRKSEKLPAVLVENGNIVYCRMHMCDFRFPLPDGTRLVKVSPLTGGFDAIEGTIYVATTNGTTVNIDDYSGRLSKYRLEEGGRVTPTIVAETPNIASIHFSYWGDY